MKQLRRLSESLVLIGLPFLVQLLNLVSSGYTYWNAVTLEIQKMVALQSNLALQLFHAQKCLPKNL